MQYGHQRVSFHKFLMLRMIWGGTLQGYFTGEYERDPTELPSPSHQAMTQRGIITERDNRLKCFFPQAKPHIFSFEVLFIPDSIN